SRRALIDLATRHRVRWLLRSLAVRLRGAGRLAVIGLACAHFRGALGGTGLGHRTPVAPRAGFVLGPEVGVSSLAPGTRAEFSAHCPARGVNAGTTGTIAPPRQITAVRVGRVRTGRVSTGGQFTAL